MKYRLALICSLLILSGCTIRVADMTVASTKNYNINSSKFVKGARVTGKDGVAVILFPFGFPNVKSAMDNAVEQDRCAIGLSDVVVSEEIYSFLFGYIGYRIDGDLIIDASQPGCENRFVARQER